ncbi:MAG: Holliday junction resolvase RuvX [Clostridia bacterium]|nr:Holliday junction resolvase RuvX [Clostridia bacterium]
MGRVLGLDIGDRRIGVALSDETRLIASPYCVLQSVGWGPDCRAIGAIMAETGAELIVSGLPRNMDGSIGFQAKKIQDFCEVLRNAGWQVEFIDERLTTVTAQNALIAGGMRREDRKQHVDKVAAAVILQAWLDRTRNETVDKRPEFIYHATVRDERIRAMLSGTTKEFIMADEEKMIPDNQEYEDDEPDIIELTDEEGVTTKFEYLTTIDYEGDLYVALLLLNEEEEAADDEDGEVLILKIEQDDSGEDIYVSVDDDAVAEAVFNKYMEMVEEEENE